MCDELVTGGFCVVREQLIAELRITGICLNPGNRVRTLRAFLRARTTRAHNAPTAQGWTHTRPRLVFFCSISATPLSSNLTLPPEPVKLPQRYVWSDSTPTAPSTRRDDAFYRGWGQQSGTSAPMSDNAMNARCTSYHAVPLGALNGLAGVS
jgi:hypothetical protein